jgi:pantoate--beta-alanine ligase
MVRDLNFPLEMVICPTTREADGLAMSSRNKYLNEAERKAAVVLFRSLSAAKELYEGGERDAEKIRGKMKEVLASRAAGADAIRFLCRLRHACKSWSEIKGKALLSMAVFSARRG